MLKRARVLLGAKSDDETLELALEKVVEGHEALPRSTSNNDMPEEYWEDLFSEPKIRASIVKETVREEREDRY